MPRAPLVPGTLLFGAGVALSLIRPAPAWVGPLLFPLLLAAVVGSALATSGRLRLRPSLLLGLLLLAGATTGTATLTRARRSCATDLPTDVRLLVHGTVMQGGAEPRVRIGRVEAPAGPRRCDMEAGTRWREARGGSPMTTGSGFGAVVHIWRAPGAGVIPRPPLLLVDSAWSEAAAGEPGWWILAAGRARERARQRVDALYPKRGGLVASLLLAQRDGVEAEVRERYARAGLSHLLAISGLHVGLVSGVLLLLAGVARMPRRSAAVAAAVGTVGYVAFLGAPHAATRAAVQIVLLLAGRALQRPAQAASLMAAAALVILACDPAAVISPGFQLSFAGVAGILALRRPLLRHLRSAISRASGRAAGGGSRASTAVRWITDGVATSLAATLATAPIAAWHFGRVAPVGVFANLAAIPLMGAIIPALALSLLLSLVSQPAGAFVAGAGNALLWALDRIAGAAAGVPWGAFAVSGPAVLVLALALLAGFAVARRLGRLRPSVRGTSWVAVSAAVVLLAPVRPGSGRLELHMIDVGQGDALALRTPAGQWLLVDAGPSSARYDAGERVVVPYLRRHGARRLEALVLTHPDADHTGGSAAVVRALHPRWVGDPGVPAGKGLYLDVLRATARTGVPWIGLSRGAVIDVDGVHIDVVHPVRAGLPVEDANEASVVIRVSYGAFSALLTGDAPTDVEDEIVEHYGSGLRSTVLKVGHHGSATATGDGILAATRPRLALLSVGRHNHFGHPAPSVVRSLQQHGIRILRSDDDGSVVVSVDRNDQLEVRRERGTAP